MLDSYSTDSLVSCLDYNFLESRSFCGTELQLEKKRSRLKDENSQYAGGAKVNPEDALSSIVKR